jgi:hypothetical protein
MFKGATNHRQDKMSLGVTVLLGFSLSFSF